MKKRLLTVLIALLLLFALPASTYAKIPEMDSIESITIQPSLSFDGNTAYCGLNATGNSYSDTVYATLKLWRGSTLLNTWYAYGTYQVIMDKTATVSYGYTYKLTADVIINGVARPTVTVTRYH